MQDDRSDCAHRICLWIYEEDHIRTGIGINRLGIIVEDV